jgi:hypothetical protein
MRKHPLSLLENNNRIKLIRIYEDLILQQKREIQRLHKENEKLRDVLERVLL